MFKRFEIVASYPAYDVVKLLGGSKVYDGEILTDENHLENWKLGSVVGYAIEKGLNPIQEYDKAIKNNHETHYAFSLGSRLSNDPKKQEKRIMVKYGDKIEFQGEIFIIKKAPNNNIKLVKESK